MRTLRFHQVDVFADQPLAGNPLAVFTSADGLSTDQMQAIAREMNLSETTFVMTAAAAGDARVRIFTPVAELPFAGHPTVGTACELVRLGLVEAVEPVTRVVLELDAGPTVVEVNVRDGLPVAATVHQGPPRFGSQVAPEEAATVLRLATSDLHPDLPPTTVGTALMYTIIPLLSTEALARVAPDMQILGAFEHAHAEVYPCAFTGVTDPWVEARGLFPLLGIPEDPATGSAAGPLAAYMARAGLLSPQEERVVLQGRHVGRPSRLTVSVSAGLADVLVGGAVQLVAQGELYVPG